MATRKRPNPAVAASEREAEIAEDMAKLAATSMPKRNATPGALKNIAERRRTTARKIRKEKPYLISEGS